MNKTLITITTEDTLEADCQCHDEKVIDLCKAIRDRKNDVVLCVHPTLAAQANKIIVATCIATGDSFSDEQLDIIKAL